MENDNADDVDKELPFQNNENSTFITRKITVEPIYLIMYLSFSLTDAAGINLILSRTCTNVFGYSESNCTEEKIYHMKHKIQPYAAKIIMWEELTMAIFPAILCLFIGSWMDTFKKRKPFIYIPLVGMMLDYGIWLIFVYFPLPPLFVLVAVLPYALTGGFVTLTTCCYCYLSDITNEDNRTFRIIMIVRCTTGRKYDHLQEEPETVNEEGSVSSED